MRDLEVEYDMEQLPKASLETTAVGQYPTDILDLTRLPLEMQRVLSLILLMPLGALVTCVFRNIVGLKTSGTFTPTLLALSLVFADWKTGCIILVAALVLGIATRYLIDGLKLLILPRLSIMLTLVVFCIVFGISALEYFRIAPGTQAVLLPMVILTMLVERFYITTQEDGAGIAFQHLLGTLVVGFCCYLVLCWEAVAQLILAYPEAHCFTRRLAGLDRTLHGISVVGALAVSRSGGSAGHRDTGDGIERRTIRGAISLAVLGLALGIAAIRNSRHEPAQRVLHFAAQPAEVLRARGRQTADQADLREARDPGTAHLCGD